jgi:DNA-binding GntR family transcriptional regulator
MSKSSEPLSTLLYLELKRRIIAGVYPQGMRLMEQHIAEELNVSRIPLREAIPQLEVEGFIQNAPRKGVVVSTWTPRDVDELFDARLALESRAAWLAAERVTKGGSPDRLRAAFRESEMALHAGDPLDVSIVNARYHEELVAASGNQLLVRLMSVVAGRTAWLFYLTSQRNSASACADHLAITEAVAEGNGLLAKSLVEAHIESGRRPTFRILEQALAAQGSETTATNGNQVRHRKEIAYGPRN